MNIPASSRPVKGRDPPRRRCDVPPVDRRPRRASCHHGNLVRPGAAIRLLPSRQPWPLQVFASSLAVHALGIALAGWATHGKPGTSISSPSERVSRVYDIRYLVLNGPPTRPEPPPREAGRQDSRHRVPLSSSGSTPQNVPRPPHPRGRSAGAWRDRGSRPDRFDSNCRLHRRSRARGDARIPGADSQPGAVQARLDRLPELVGGTGSACPELRASATRTTGQSAVAVAFVVDTNGRVDPATLQVLESPGQPRTDHRFLTRVYVVGANCG